MKSFNFFHDRWNSRLDWARSAVNEFRKGLSSEVTSFLPEESKTTCNVAVYGKSQVGKTTLILRLMGIDSKEVDDALRAGRPEGKSCTSTAIFYRRSPDDCWHASYDSEPVHDLGTDVFNLVQWLQGVREHVENGGVLHDPIELFIPTHYFNDTEAHVEILDLPGINSSTSKEREHVRYVSEKYLPIMELVLLVSRTDSIVELFPKEGFGIPFLDNWNIFPNRFRFVTTYALQPQSMRDYFTLHEPLSASSLRLKISMKAENDLNNSSLSKILPSLLFPVDVGKSWHDLKEKHPKLYEQAQPVLDEVLDELRVAIIETSDEWSKLAAPFSWRMVIENQKTKVLEERIKDLEDKDNNIVMLKVEQENLEKSLNNLSKKIAVLEENRSELKKQLALCPELKKQLALCPIVLPENDFSSCESVSCLQEKLGRYERELIKVAKESLDKHNEWCRGISWRMAGVVEKSATEVQKSIATGMVSLSCIRQRLDSYWIDSYWSEDNLDNDRRDCRKAITDLTERASGVLSAWFKGGIVKIAAEQKKDALSLADSKKLFEEQVKKLNHKISIEERDKDVLIEKFDTRLKDIQKSLDSALRYTSFLNEKWRCEMERRWDSITDEVNPTLRLLYGCEFLQLHFDMRKLEAKVP